MKQVPRTRKAYERERVSLAFVDADGVPLPSLTKQQCRDECDIARIIEQYDRTGLIRHVSASVARYGDFSEVNEYQESLNRVIAAQEAFEELPAAIRKRFGNDPGTFFEFATDPANLPVMRELGLALPESLDSASRPAAEPAEADVGPIAT